ncbi:MAG: polysaccharide biosynthesis protein [Bacteroidales bacterium]|nr:polysaccharide biosynthesis protein [Bacteroidales bacterium]
MIKKFVYWFLRKYRHTTASRWLILAIDIFTLILAFTVTDLLRLRMMAHIDWPSLAVRLGAFIALASACYMIVGTHRSIIRHSGLYDIYKVVISNGIATVVLILFNLLNNNHPIIQNRYTPAYSEILMTFALQIVAMTTVRLILQRVYNDYVRRRRPSCNVLIYGAGAAGVIAQNALLQDRTREYRIVSFLDDDRKKTDTALNGIRVILPQNGLNADYIKKHQIEVLLIAIPSIKLEQKQAIMNLGLDLGLTVKAVPHISKWINDSFSANQIKDIQIEDLLERETIKLDNINIVREVVDKVVLVTGAAGSIGSEICRQLIQYAPKQVVMLDQAESPMYDLQFELRNNEPYCHHTERMEFVIANVKDRQRMAEIFSHYKPQIVFHAAAYKHVPFMEENPYEAILVNVFGTKNLADLSIQNGTQKFVMISTDKAVNPTNVMGATKRMAEIYIQSRSTDTTHFVTTRFGNVLGSNGSVIPLFKKQLAAGGPLTVTHRDIIRYFMTIPEACNLVLEAGAMGEGGDIFVFDMGKPVKIYDLAKKMIQLSGLKEIEIKEVGLRPGEKLYEELLANKEADIPTYHPKIMRAQVRRYPIEDIDRAFAELWDLMPTLDSMTLVAKMKQIVPEFKSNNSIYCQLDQPSDPS